MSDRAATGAPPRPDLATREDVEALVRAFYRDAATDELLGPVFEAAEVDWPQHVDTLTRFWSWQLLGQPGYDGNPLVAHRPAHAATPFTPAHFERWLDLFTTTVDEHFEGPTAAAAKQRAAKMARALARLLDDRSAPGTDPVTPFVTVRRR